MKVKMKMILALVVLLCVIYPMYEGGAEAISYYEFGTYDDEPILWFSMRDGMKTIFTTYQYPFRKAYDTGGSNDWQGSSLRGYINDNISLNEFEKTILGGSGGGSGGVFGDDKGYGSSRTILGNDELDRLGHGPRSMRGDFWTSTPIPGTENQAYHRQDLLPPNITVEASLPVYVSIRYDSPLNQLPIKSGAGSREDPYRFGYAELLMNPTNPADGTLSTVYAGHTFNAAGGNGSKTYAVTAGALPNGLSLSANGTLTGTPNTAGTFNFTVTATDSAPTPVTDSRAYTMNIAAEDLLMNPTNPVDGTLSTVYAGHTFNAAGGNGSKTYAVTAGALPNGLSLSANGTLTGTPHTAGTFTFTVTATDSAPTPVTDSRAYTMNIAAEDLLMNPTNPVDGTVSTAYTSHTFTATGGSGSKTYAVTAGALPNGLALSANGTLTGTPNTAGTFNFNVTVTDSAPTPVTDSRAYTMNIAAEDLLMNPTNPVDGTVSTAYTSHTFTATGGSGSKTYAVTAGALPNGLALSANGTLTGTPHTAGTFTFTVTATDSAPTPVTDSRAYTMNIAAEDLLMNPTNPVDGTVSTAYTSHTFTATGGSGSKTYAVTAGALPNGLALSANGTLTGTPSTAGAFTFNVTVTDSAPTPVTDSHTFTMNIAAEDLLMNPTNPVDGTVSTVYAGHTFTATGGNGSKTYEVTAGALPNGLTLSANGTLTGTPHTAGTFNFTVTVTDSAPTPVTDSHTFTMNIMLNETNIPEKGESGGSSGGGGGSSSTSERSQDKQQQAEDTEDTSGAEDIEEVEGSKDSQEASPPRKKILLTIGNQDITLGNETHQLDAMPFIDGETNRTLVPLKFISEALGATVTWLPETRQVLITERDTEILLTIGSKEVLVNGEMILIDTEPRIIPPGRTFVPLRVIGELLGATVTYDEGTREISIAK
ncbi:putative Ig domain-containing protein [Anoxynatronum sibiricum]|uniref:Ig domain-containing protein n=1 Tax=Anoxynatronum sibiricum TaxID=210623 RepID=A0ABU9VYG8_9CLOT